MKLARALTVVLLAGLRLEAAPLGAAPPESRAQAPLNQLTPEEQKAGWRLLFDGRTTRGWRGFGQSDARLAAWTVQDGCLQRLSGSGDAQGGNDIVTEDAFSDFDLRWEWRVGPRGNSGIKYFVLEERGRPIAHEYQMIDDPGYVGEGTAAQTTASFYDVIPPARDAVLRPAGQWNASRILVKGDHVEHWLNGRLAVQYQLGSPQVLAAVAKSKFKDVPGFGTKVTGRILLQDHQGGEVCFRNIKILAAPRAPAPEQGGKR